jgi:transcriptional regulator
MYLPSHFAETRLDVLHQLMRAHPLATLVTLTPGGLVANHIPLQLQEPPAGAIAADAPGVLLGHVARANPLWREIAQGSEVLAVFQGPQHYISPNWYPSKQESGKVVPTWNYCCVHAHGRLQVHEDAKWIRAQVGELTTHHEASQPRPWAVEDAPDDYLQTMLANIVGIEIAITRLEGKWKASQNHPAPNRAGVMAGLSALAGDAEAAAMAALVREREPPPKP